MTPASTGEQSLPVRSALISERRKLNFNLPLPVHAVRFALLSGESTNTTKDFSLVVFSIR
jgi:hypothetical protein